ncbi:MAG: T9SS type A sorting domain-containing protein [Bacteroidia bacterium]|nr:T9SS type A sorting domain-containing protein [Bacteroidia bacterium]
MTCKSLASTAHWSSVFIIFFALTLSVVAQTVTWNGGATGSWDTPGNWSGSAVPTVNDNVQINGGSSGVVISLPSNRTVKALTVLGQVTLSSSTTTLTTGTLEVIGTLSLDRGTSTTTNSFLQTTTISLAGRILKAVGSNPVRIAAGGRISMIGVLDQHEPSYPAYIGEGVRTVITHTGTPFGSHVRFDGDLEFPPTNNKLFDLGIYDLYLGKNANLTISPTDGAGYIATTSTHSNTPVVGRLCREFDANSGPFLFPVGPSQSNGKYVPIRIGITGPVGTFGTANPFPYISVRVVAEKHPDNQQTNGSFNLYWVVKGYGMPDPICLNVDMTYHNYYRTGSPAPLYSARYTPNYESAMGIWDLTGSQISSSGGNVRFVNMGPCVPGFGDFTIAVEGSALPVELTSFSARYVREQVELKWQTATELNNYGFAIERSVDGKVWTEVDFVQGAGTSNSPRSYSWTDQLDEKLRGNEKLAYRLLQMDRDGRTEYSNIVYVTLGPAPAFVELHEAYPNPFNPATTVSFTLPEAMPVTVRVQNLLGQNVVTLLENASFEAGVHTVSFNGDRLPSGAYIVLLQAGDVVRHQRIVLSK